MRPLGKLLTLLAGVLETAVLSDDSHHRRNVFVAGGLALEQPLDHRPRRRRHLAQRVDEWQCHLVLPEIEPRWLAGGLLLLAIVEQIVGDLEGHSQIFPKRSQRVTVAPRARERAELARGAHQRRGLRPDQIVILTLRKSEGLRYGELAHFAERHLRRSTRECLQRFEISERDE